jgi:receptor protein-tyrosine kinase
MSTIERAAARLGAVGKREVPVGATPSPELAKGEVSNAQTLESNHPISPPTSVDDGVETARQDVAAAPADAVPRAPTMFVGGGRVDVDLASLAARGFVVGSNVETELATDFRRIKRPLLLAVRKAESESHENPANLVVITSSLPGEGKTFTSVNLAFSIAAEMDRSVLLVDGDVAKSSITEVLGIRYEFGLTDVLSKGGAHIEDAVLKTNVDGLEVLPSGPRLPHTDELFASDLMRRTMHELARQDARRLVIVDGPPLLARTEAPNLARLAGHVIVIVEADRTPQASVAEALTLLEGCPRVSLMLNKVTRRASDRHGYGYGYGYGYGQRSS